LIGDCSVCHLNFCQLLYAKLLSAAGDTAMAARLEAAAKESLQKIQQQGAGWSVSAEAFQ
jgi:hypothetical protein